MDGGSSAYTLIYLQKSRLKEIQDNPEEGHLAMNGKEKEVEVVGEVANRLLTDEG